MLIRAQATLCQVRVPKLVLKHSLGTVLISAQCISQVGSVGSHILIWVNETMYVIVKVTTKHL